VDKTAPKLRPQSSRERAPIASLMNAHNSSNDRVVVTIRLLTPTIDQMSSTLTTTALFEVAALERRAFKAVRTLAPSNFVLEVLAEAAELSQNLMLLAAVAEQAEQGTHSTNTMSSLAASAAKSKSGISSLFLQDIPDDCLARCLSFLGTAADRFALQCTSKKFRRVSNHREVLESPQIVLGGDRTKGTLGIIRDNDTPLSAKERLEPFVAAGHSEACHMMGVINVYCRLSWNLGIELLKRASEQGYVQSTYALGLVLREVRPREAANFMRRAAKAGYYPAEMELFRTRKLRRRHGSLKPKSELLKLMDCEGLNRLLTRDHAEFYSSADLYAQKTHQCCNQVCGKWAYDTHPIVCWPVRKHIRRCLMTSRKIGPEATYCSKLCEKYHELTFGSGTTSLREKFLRAMRRR